VLTAFLLCVGMVISIVRTLVPARSAWLWGLVLATSIHPMEGWVLDIRGDFPAILFTLTAIRLLMTRSPKAVLIVGACAGFATQFKFVYVAALLAGSLWLLLRRKWKESAIFIAAAALSSGGLYFLFWLREPRTLAQTLALSPGIPDVWAASNWSLTSCRRRWCC
jgi:Na+-translocating ferredoxin:NAD+ oxidoreductase RnfD subunit